MIKWLPNPPTDSLHKYLALHFLWFIYAIIVILGVLEYQNFQSEEYNKRQSWLYSKQDAVRRFEARLLSLEKGRVNENVVPGISNIFPPKDEAIFLQNALKLNLADIPALIEQTKTLPANLLPILTRQYFVVVLIGVSFFACLFSIFGFSKWFKMQRVADEIQKTDLEVKRHQLLGISLADEIQKADLELKRHQLLGVSLTDEIQKADLDLRRYQLRDARRIRLPRRG